MTPTLMNDGVDHAAELARMAEYVNGSMSATDAERFEAELVADPKFFDRMAPLMNVWLAPEPLPAIAETLAELDDELSAARERRERRRAIRYHIAAAVGSVMALKPMLTVGGLVAVASVAFFMTPHEPTVLEQPKQTLAQRPVVESTPPGSKPPTVMTVPTIPARMAARKAIPPRTEVVALVPLVDTAGDRAAADLVKALGAPTAIQSVAAPAAAPVTALAIAPGRWASDSMRRNAIKNPLGAGPKVNGRRGFWWWLHPSNWKPKAGAPAVPTKPPGGSLS